jgi:ribulose-5-phosphate 4-epimerase/fuculose-1-phosphate aldolase
MVAIAEPTLDQVLDLAHRLSRSARLELIARLAQGMVTDDAPAPPAAPDLLLPVLEGGTWYDDLPRDREELYGEHGRG